LLRIRAHGSTDGMRLPIMPAMGETAAIQEPGPDQAETAVAPRERVALGAFVVVAVVATVSWLVLLGWLLLVGIRALG
jgi:hypothetical protein